MGMLKNGNTRNKILSIKSSLDKITSKLDTAEEVIHKLETVQ